MTTVTRLRNPRRLARRRSRRVRRALATRIAGSINGRSPLRSASSTPACRLTSNSAPAGMPAWLRSDDPSPKVQSKR
jgi:hypothetical protein